MYIYNQFLFLILFIIIIIIFINKYNTEQFININPIDKVIDVNEINSDIIIMPATKIIFKNNTDNYIKFIIMNKLITVKPHGEYSKIFYYEGIYKILNYKYNIIVRK